jgi:hypothetical protein
VRAAAQYAQWVPLAFGARAMGYSSCAFLFGACTGVRAGEQAWAGVAHARC